ncbi:transcriptional antiterminator [Enterococcus sp. DIV0756]|uniref:transcriptional antiterminator n=1 Tax=Enterococcus sp. DIV0756 TaxID=2774636 RepID=UPI003F1E5115
MATQQEKLLHRIEELTQEQIMQGTYDFSECCALVLSVDLAIDRSNVSRLLNKLHQEKQLIKLKGRPTLFISTQILTKSFPYLSLPHTIQKDDHLNNYLFLNETSVLSSSEFQLDTLDIGENSSLYNVVQNVLPIFYYPSNELKTIILRGEKGVGRKFFLEKLIEQTKMKGTSKSTRKIFYTLWPEQSKLDILPELKRKKDGLASFLVIELDSSVPASDVSRKLDELSFYYKNEGGVQPLVALLIPPQMQNIEQFYEISPYVGYFPKFSERPLKEKVEIISNIYLTECRQISREIMVTKKVIQSLAAISASSNIAYIKKEILYSISQAFFNRNMENTTGTTILVSTRHLSEKVDQNVEGSRDEKRFWDKFPERLTFSAQSNQSTLEILNNTQDENWLTDQQAFEKQTIEQLINALPTNLIFYSEQDYQHTLEKRLFNFLSETPLIKDPILQNFVIKTISEILKGSFPIENYTFPKQEENFKGINGILKKIERFLRKYQKGIAETKITFIRKLIILGIKKVTDVKVPMLISARENSIAENLAQRFNELIGKREIFSMSSRRTEAMDKGEVHSFVRKMSKNLKTIDRGGGTVLVTDYDPSNDVDNKILLEIRLLTFTTYPPTMAHIYDILRILNGNIMSVVSVSSAIINKKNEHKKFLDSDSLNDRAERTNSEYYELFNQLFSRLNTAKTNEVLYKLLKNIANDLAVSLSNKLIIDFLFQGNCLLEKHMTNDHDPSDQIDHPDYKVRSDQKFQRIKKQLDQAVDLSFIDFTDEDIMLLTYLF